MTDVFLRAHYEGAGIDLAVERGLVVDAGAHVGLFALRVNARRVLALEPDRDNARVLERNARDNGVPLEHLPVALWEHGRGATLYHGTHSGGGSLIEKPGARRSTVATASLNDLVRDHGDIDLLKMDVEGAECRVLAAASDETLHSVSAITVELHPECDEGPVVERLRRLGFEVTVGDASIHHVIGTLRRLIRNRGRLVGLTRLKLVVFALHLIGAPLIVLFPWLEQPRLKGLYAVRRKE